MSRSQPYDKFPNFTNPRGNVVVKPSTSMSNYINCEIMKIISRPPPPILQTTQFPFSRTQEIPCTQEFSGGCCENQTGIYQTCYDKSRTGELVKCKNK